MSASDAVEDMECEPSPSNDQDAEVKDEVQVTLSVSSSESQSPQKFKRLLEKVLQSWANISSKQTQIARICRVLKVSEDGRALISIEPAPVVRELQGLIGKTLPQRDGITFTITSVSLAPPDLETPKPDDASVEPPTSSVPKTPDEPMQQVEESRVMRSAAVSTAEEGTCTCPLPVSHFWYVNHIYKKEIQQIEEENGVKMEAEVHVTFKANEKIGGPEKALSDFINIVQKCLGESEGSTFPLKNVDPAELKDTLTIIQKPENKILLTLVSEEATICGPRKIQDAIRKSLNLAQKTLTNTSTSAGESTWASQAPPLNISMSIKDPLANDGLTMDGSSWKRMKTSFDQELDKIEAKFNVDFKESGISHGKVEVKPHYKRPRGNKSMESHAVRALLRLYQVVETSPMNFTKDPGAMGVNSTHKNFGKAYQSEEASGGPALNGQSEYSKRNTEAPTSEGATAGDNKDENCPICMDAFTEKTQLKCKHEFCEECLAQSVKSMGSVCPVCKDVFGVIEGDQPDGKMYCKISPVSLPGFPNCGTIIINYDIPGGRQTERHPNPGQYYSSVNRTAYLPNNKEGQQVQRLLEKAFDRKLIFTVGTSRTTGMDNQVTWNDIHHKTSTAGGPQSFGYPDPDYLSRVREELKAKGIE